MILTSDCPCPGHNITFECAAVGGGTTIYTGDIFDCPNNLNEIVLRHILFSTSVTGQCNAGEVIGRGLRRIDNQYTSELSIVYKESFAGQNITCIYDNGIEYTSNSITITHSLIGKHNFVSNIAQLSWYAITILNQCLILLQIMFD